jgi:RNA:NAD 2'-phosphotransferase (TPT1/KptA family)
MAMSVEDRAMRLPFLEVCEANSEVSLAHRDSRGRTYRQAAVPHDASKWLSGLLRHNAERYGIHMRADGFVSVRDVIQAAEGASNPHVRNFYHDVSDVESVVRQSTAHRFQLLLHRRTVTHVRCLQGHSSSVVDDHFTSWPLRLPDMLNYIHHIMDVKDVESIADNGLIPGANPRSPGRLHVYTSWLVPGHPNYTGDMPDGASVNLSVSVKATMEHGVRLRLTACGAVVTRQVIPPTCFISLISRTYGTLCFFDNGVVRWHHRQAEPHLDP